MAEFKLILSNSKGQSIQKEVKDEQAAAFINKIIGDKISGDLFGFSGYEFEITGGSDSSGFPMRRDVMGRIRRKILTTTSTGVHVKRKGIRKRKTVAGNTIYEGISQINLKVIKEGKEPLVAKEVSKEEEAEKKEEKAAEKKESVEKKKEAKKEEKPAEKKEEKAEEKEEKSAEEKSKEEREEPEKTEEKEAKG